MVVIWSIDWDHRALKELRSLDKQNQQKILKYLNDRVSPNPRVFGKELSANLSGLWRYRVENFRIVCQIEDHKLRVLVVTVGHRKDIYS